MVQKMSDIMSNYQDMSVAEIGTSLLSRQEEQRSKAENGRGDNLDSIYFQDECLG